jgi:hypothetical protein
MRFADELAQRLGESFRILTGACDDEDAAGAVSSKDERKVNGALSIPLGELRLFDRANHADNGEQLRVLGLITGSDR